VHRDVKPSNVMIVFDEDGMVAKVTDFGIARGPSSKVKTMTGLILGSPRYMSPEQVVGKNVGPRSDIFSLGVVLYEMLGGIAPFDADSVSSIMYQTVHVREESLKSLNAAVPDALEAIVAKALAKMQDDRTRR
jgi:serine/threonine-protein kinase